MEKDAAVVGVVNQVSYRRGAVQISHRSFRRPNFIQIDPILSIQ